MTPAAFDRLMDQLVALTGAVSGGVSLALVASHEWQDPLYQGYVAVCGVGFLAIAAAAAWRLR